MGLLSLWATGLLTSARPHASPLLALPLLVVVLALSLLIHEAGHAIAAKLVGWRVLAISVWRLKWNLHTGELRFTRWGLGERAWGWVVAVPWSADRATLGRHALMVAGGPIASLVQSLVGFALAILLGQQNPVVGFRLANLFAGLAVGGLILFVSTILPAGSDKSDGGKLRRIWRQWRSGGGSNLVARLAVMLTLRVRLRDIPSWYLTQVAATAGEDEAVQRLSDTLEIGRALDAEVVDLVRARYLLNAYRARYAESDWLNCCDAYFAAAHERDADKANSLVARLGDPCEEPALEAAARAASAMLAGRVQGSRDWLERMVSRRKADNPFKDATFRDIRRQIEAISPLATCDSAQPPPTG